MGEPPYGTLLTNEQQTLPPCNPPSSLTPPGNNNNNKTRNLAVVDVAGRRADPRLRLRHRVPDDGPKGRPQRGDGGGHEQGDAGAVRQEGGGEGRGHHGRRRGKQAYVARASGERSCSWRGWPAGGLHT